MSPGLDEKVSRLEFELAASNELIIQLREDRQLEVWCMKEYLAALLFEMYRYIYIYLKDGMKSISCLRV